MHMFQLQESIELCIFFRDNDSYGNTEKFGTVLLGGFAIRLVYNDGKNFYYEIIGHDIHENTRSVKFAAEFIANFGTFTEEER